MFAPFSAAHAAGAAAGFVVLTLAACAPDAAPLAPQDASLNAAAHAAAPVRLDFQKCLVDPANFVWEGSVSGDVSGDLRTELHLADFSVTGAVWQVRFDWIITAGAQSFVADLSGILNTRTGGVVMNGTVVDGYLAGARVHEEGQLVDAENSCFEGTIRIVPASAR